MRTSTMTRREARLQRVEEHVGFENAHDLDGILGTLAPEPVFQDLAWNDTRVGLPEVRAHYAELLRGIPNLAIDVSRCHAADETVLLEATVRGTHIGTLHGLPATGRRFEFPLCAVYTFDEEDRVAGERIYYDRATVLAQVGLFRDPRTPLGRWLTPLRHPFTVTRALSRAFLRL